MPARDRADWTFLQTALRTAALEGVALAGGVAHGVAGARCALLTAADDMGPDIGQGRAATHHYTTAQAAETKTTEPVAWARPGCLVSTLHRLAAACTKPGTRGRFFAPCSSHNYT